MRLQGILLLLLLSLASSYPEIWPPNGRLTPNNYLPPPDCKYEHEEVFDDVLEETCTTIIKEECKNETVVTEEKKIVQSCEKAVDKVCTNNTVIEEIEKCKTMIEEVCDPCEAVITDKCDEVYDTQYKEECSYDTIIDRKCSRSYAVPYKDQCRFVMETQCRMFGRFLCGNVRKVKCEKVPKFPAKRCQTVPRLEKRCKQVPVQRILQTCQAEKKKDCEARQCSEVSTNTCEQIPVEIVRESCEDVMKNVCTDETVTIPVKKKEKVCTKQPEKICKQHKVKRQRLVPKRVCKELKKINPGKNP